MKMKVIMYIAILLAIVYGGYWQLRKKSDAKREELALLLQQEAEKKEVEKRQRAGLMEFANGMRKHCNTRLKDVERCLTELRTTSKQMSDIASKIMEEKDSRGVDAKYEVRILHVIENADLNALALKYLAMDFTSIRAEFCERVREARMIEEKYASAVKEIEASYTETMKMAREWGKMSAGQRNNEMARLRNELSQLETRREKALKEYKNLPKMQLKGSGLWHDRRDRENVLRARILDVESQIAKKRHQIDYLQSPNVISQIEATAIANTQNRQSSATSWRQSAMSDIDRRLKPKVSLVDIVSEFEGKTIGRLRSTLSEKIASFEQEQKSLSDRLVMIDEFLLAAPVTEVQELMRRKSKLESK